jgi:hypothetical protein
MFLVSHALEAGYDYGDCNYVIEDLLGFFNEMHPTKIRGLGLVI